MVTVTLWGSLRSLAEGQAQVQVEGTTFKAVLDALVARYPGLGPQVARGVSMAVDGRIYKEAWFTPIRPDSEVVLMPYMQGG